MLHSHIFFSLMMATTRTVQGERGSNSQMHRENAYTHRHLEELYCQLCNQLNSGTASSLYTTNGFSRNWRYPFCNSFDW